MGKEVGEGEGEKIEGRGDACLPDERDTGVILIFSGAIIWCFDGIWETMMGRMISGSR